MFSSTGFSRLVAVALAVACDAVPAYADSEFPFGLLLTLETRPQPGSKRMPTLEIGDNGEATLDLWCKSGNGQFSVAGNTVIFVPGQMQDRGTCAPGQSEADADTLAALTDAATWKRDQDMVEFIGTKSLRFRINTN